MFTLFTLHIYTVYTIYTVFIGYTIYAAYTAFNAYTASIAFIGYRVTLIVGLPPRLTSFWIISSQISSQILHVVPARLAGLNWTIEQLMSPLIAYTAYNAALGCIGQYKTILCCTGLYWAESGCTGPYWAVVVCTGLYRAVFGCTGLYLAVLGYTGQPHRKNTVFLLLPYLKYVCKIKLVERVLISDLYSVCWLA